MYKKDVIDHFGTQRAVQQVAQIINGVFSQLKGMPSKSMLHMQKNARWKVWREHRLSG